MLDATNDILEIMRARHSVRSYIDRPVEGETLEQLENVIARCNEASGLSMTLITNETRGARLGRTHYGTLSGVGNYLVVAGNPSESLDELAGYWGEEAVLEAQRLGLNTCWLGLTLAKRKAEKLMPADKKIPIVIAVGYGATQGRARKSKTPSSVSNLTDTSPDWFARGVEAALLAPTAMNRQGFFLTLHDDGEVSISDTGGFFSKVDRGIVRHDFEAAAGAERFAWKNPLVLPE